MTGVPQHVAIIMDGNGRWAEARGLSRSKGHEKGSEATREVVQAAQKAGVKYLTIYAFSEENWERPQEEVGFLMQLLVLQVRKYLAELADAGVQLKLIGNREKLDPKVLVEIEKAEEKTATNDSLVLQVALSYGARQEILRAVELSNGDSQKFEENLFTSEVPDPDLLIRTGGEKRISNFLLWQIAYTELYFCDTFWPDFGEAEFQKALEEYAKRERRFGKTE